MNLLSIFSLLVIASLTLIHIPKSFCQDQQYVTCGEPFRCGDKNFGYPFWGGSRPSSCGYPGFELTCRDNATLLTFQSLGYRILAINGSRQNLTVARDDLWNDLCPRFIHDTAFNYSIFKHSPGLWNVTISYGCKINIPNLPQPNRFDCPGNNSDVTTTSFYAATTFGINPTDAGCNRSISVPIKERAAQTLVNSTVLQATLRDGFGIEWEANNSVCDECTRSKGRCGYNTSTSSFICFCSDRPYDLTCGNTGNGGGGSSGVNTPISIVLAIAGAVIAGVGLGWLIFFCRQRRKRLQAAESSQVAQTESKELPTTPFANKAALTPPDTFTKSIPSYPSSKSEFGRDSSYFGVQVFSYHELEEATENFSQSRELGDGGFGIVYYGVLADGRIVAVKRLYENNFKRVEQFINEVEILTRLRHTNLVTLYGCTSKRSRELLLVYEYISNGTVADHLHGKRSTSGLLSWPIRLNIAIETADALAYLHASDIIHRDVKTNNILLDNDFHVKVADFGLSRLFPTDVTHVSTAPQGTPGYVDPEYYQCYQLTEKSDVYSFGVVLIELLSSLQAVDTNRHRHDINLANMAINKIQNHTLDELVDASLDFGTNSSVRRMITQVSELAFRCLQQERDMRPSMQEVVNALRKIQNEGLNAQKVEVVDILIDDGGIVKDNVSPPSPDSVNDKWASISTPTSSGVFLALAAMAAELSNILPRVLIVSRRTVRKNKFVDFVGEYHLDLIVNYGAVPVIVPRVSGVHLLLDSFEPIHGVLLCEGEDIDPSLYEGETTGLSPEELEEIRRLHAGDTAIDKEKDTIEFRLAKLCLERNIPYLGICRGSQVLNVACGGSLYMDLCKELSKNVPENERVMHMDYDNYDGHRHAVKVVENTPLHHWFKDSLEEEKMELWVNSYHHQGVKRLAQRFVPMAFAPDGLMEGFYDPDAYNPEEGKFIMGLQFHPERMRQHNSDEFDYPGCPFAYQEFVKAVIAYQKKLNASRDIVPKAIKLNQEMEKKRKIIVRSFSLAKNIYNEGRDMYPSKQSELEVGAEFLESNTALTLEQESRLKQMGATVRNANSYFQRLKMNEEKEALARKMMGKMTVEQLSELGTFYHMMGQICSEVLEKKLQGIYGQ